MQQKPRSNNEKRALNLEYAFNWGVDFDNRIVRLTQEVDTGQFEFIDAALTELESQSRKGITVRIHSPGGSVYEALGVIGRIRKSNCQIITEGYGQIMSAATAILACGDKRKMSKYSWFMHHESYYGMEGRHSEIKAHVVQQQKEEQQWCEIMEEFTGVPAMFWMEEGLATDAYFNAERCKDYSIVDEVF